MPSNLFGPQVSMTHQTNGLFPSIPMRFRTGGSGFTTFTWNGSPIGWAQNISVTSPQPVAAPVPIQPMDQPYPLYIMTPAAIGPGTLQVQLFEVFNYKIWDWIMASIDNTNPTSTVTAGKMGRYNDLLDVFVRMAAVGPMTCYKLIYPPNNGDRNGIPGSSSASVTINGTNCYADVYYNCMVTDIRDDEQIDIGTMEVIKNMTIMYTYSTREESVNGVT